MRNNIVSVFLWGREICKLEWQGGYKQGFGKVGALISFHPDYSKFGWNLDPAGPYNTAYYFVRKGLSDLCRAGEDEGLPRFLSGSLPDDWGNKVFSSWVESNKLRHSDITAVDKLSFIGKRGMGALEYVPQTFNAQNNETIVLEELYDLAREIEESRSGVSLNLDEKPRINDLMSVGMSAGGKHPKAVIAINRATGEVRSGQVLLPKEFTQYILKFRDSGSWPGPEVEYVYYNMAKAAGIMMEHCELLEVQQVKHFLTERFDRKNGQKQHTATLHALMGQVSSYEEIFRLCRKMRLPAPDIEQLFRRAVFNFLSCVCDDHDKNISFVMDENGKWRLSPAYDVTFSANLGNRFIDDRHSMTVGGADRSVTEGRFLRLAEENDVKRASAIIGEVADAVGNFSSIAMQTGLDGNVSRIIFSYIQRQLQALK